ncbi:MAG: M56 family metallopeptidase [Gemmatimonadetes bacterium]|nr:M56 family metallopeptidase [Gemmatimonadota bacterium]
MTTLAAWIVYAMVVSALFAFAAWTAEAALRAVGGSVRRVWLVSMVMSAAIPVAVWLRPSSWEAGGTALPAAGFIPLAPVGTIASSGPGILPIDTITAGVWILLTGAMSFWITAGMARLLESRGSWRRTVVWGESVWVTPDVGPGVFGLGRGEIVMPRWALELDRSVQRLMLMHEREHLRAGDVRLAAAGLLLLLIFPWNLALWWQFRRLREAVEVDCDRRVLGLDPDAHAYGSLLIEVGRRRSLPKLALAFAEPESFLERRLRLITAKAGRHGRRSMLFGASALLVAGVAVCTRDPLAPRSAADAMPPVELDASLGALQSQPVFTPFTVAPRLLNAQETAGMLGRTYPPLLRDAGIGGEIVMWFLVDESGHVVKTQLFRTSGYPALDEAATRVAEVMRFSPAYNRDKPVPVWVQIPIRFSALGAGATRDPRTRVAQAATGGKDDPVAIVERDRAAMDSANEETRRALGIPPLVVGEARAGRDTALAGLVFEPVSEATRQASADPSFTPFTTAPRLIDEPGVARALERNYPPLLRDAGIGGEAVLWFRIDADGSVDDVRLARSTGYPALDQAALEVAKSMRYVPAENRGTRVPVWVQVPVKFATK